MKAGSILEHFLALADWVDKIRTVDKIIIGDADADIKSILVTWMCDLYAVEYAVKNNYDMIMTHEPTFWIHENELQMLSALENTSARKQTAICKKQLIEDNGLVVMRNHDVWDLMPDIGIPWSWAKFLCFTGKPSKIHSSGYLHKYVIPPITVDRFANSIIEKTSHIGGTYIQIIGDSSKEISSVGLGTGAICNIVFLKEMGCDIAIATDDGCNYWRDICWAYEAGFPVIRVNHSTAEEPGMVTLADYINRTFAGVKAYHFPYNCRLRIVGQ